MNEIDPSKVKAGDTVTLEDRRNAAHDSSIDPDPDWRLTGRVREIHWTHSHPDGTPYAWQVRIGSTPYMVGTSHWTYTLTDHQPAPPPEVKPGTCGTGTVAGARQRVFRVAVDENASPKYVWVTEMGHRATESIVSAFVPDDAEAQREAVTAEMERLEVALGKAQREAEDFRGRYETAHASRMHAEEMYRQISAEVERLRAARTLPTREHVAEAIRGGRTSLKDYLVQFGGVPEDRILASPAVYCVQPMDAATDVLALFEQGGAAPKVTQEQAAEVLWLNEYERPWAEVSEQDHAVYMNAAAVVVARMGGAE